MLLSCFVAVLLFSTLATPVIGVDQKHVFHMEKFSLDMGSSLISSNGSGDASDGISRCLTNASAFSYLYDNEFECLEDILLHDAMDGAVSTCHDERSGDLHYDFHLPWLYKMLYDLSKLLHATMDYTTSALHKMQDMLCITQDTTMHHLYEARLQSSFILSHWSHQIQQDLMDLISAVDKKAAEYDYFWLYKLWDFLVAMDKVVAAWNIAYTFISYKVFRFCVAFYNALSEATEDRRVGYQPVRNNRRQHQRQQKRRRNRS